MSRTQARLRASTAQGNAVDLSNPRSSRRQRARLLTKARERLHDGLAGLVASVVLVANIVSFAALMFPGELASGLVDARVTVAQLRPLASLVSTEILALGLRILVADHEIFCLTRELEEASRRISDLVQAVKTYSYMDQSPVAEVDVEQGIDVTLRMFQHQLKHGVQVTRQFDQNVPRIRANGSALNQIWTNLIDNALDAMESLPPEQPKALRVKTCVERDGILVEITDNGPGISAEVQNRMFEPFFTTKPIGEGTGLGLDIVQRIVRNHKGSIRVESNPGRTAFQVRLPFS